jgi:tetratricopeptide (TPR) repeat protein
MMSVVTDSSSGLEAALSQAAKLLAEQPRLAEAQTDEILKLLPEQPNALLLNALAKAKQGKLASAELALKRLARLRPQWYAVHLELGQLYRLMGLGDKAMAALRESVALKPDSPKAWLAIADIHSANGDSAAADAAYAMQLRHSDSNPRLLAAAAAMCENAVPVAERSLKDYLQENPTDVAAIRMLAEVAARLGRDQDAELLLERCLELSPGFNFARQNYAYILNRNNNFAKVLEQTEILLGADPRNMSYRNLKAVALGKIGDFDAAIALYQEVLAEHPGYSRIWHSYGHTLKTAGRTDEAVTAYRRSISIEPHYGEAYWSLANLKTFVFTDEDVIAMQAQLDRGELAAEDRFHFDFALGKALEDRRDYERSFHHYDNGNGLRKSLIQYSADRNTLKLRQNQRLFDAEFFQKRSGFGVTDADPIFILGMPRAGSTLLEQILSSHSQVEGTMELPDIISVTKDLYRRQSDTSAGTYYPMLPAMSAEQAAVYGRRYIENTRIQRRTEAPFFIDKMPNNYAHIALIRLMLPNAKIIDARRHPLACCFSNFKQHFARGQNFSYSLDDMGRYYRDYVELMAHFDEALPGSIHRVHYENMVEDTENEVRRLLAYCGLPFEDGCLRFFENNRPVRTASSEQVRRPIYKEGVDHWRHFETWLGPLKDVLGPVLEQYPEAPVFLKTAVQHQRKGE